MELRKTTLIGGLALLALASCKTEMIDDTSTRTYAKFSATIEQTTGYKTKMSGTTWEMGDAIGIYMKATGEALADASVINDAKNVRYTTTGNGTFTSVGTGIEFPAGNNVDFIAYYPQSSDVANFAYPIDISDQSDLSAIDFLYSDNATNLAYTEQATAINFKHHMSQLILNVSAGTNISTLSGLSVTVNGLASAGDVNLATGAVVLSSTTASINLSSTLADGDPTAASINAILLPGTDLGDASISFVVGGKLFKWTPDAQVLEAGKKYTYTVSLTDNNLQVLALNPEGNIEDWTDGVITGNSNVDLVLNADIVETFEDATKSGYDAGTADFASGTWLISGGGTFNSSSDAKNGTQSIRLQGTDGNSNRLGEIEMQFDVQGVQGIKFYYGIYPASAEVAFGGTISLTAQYSLDSGTTYQDLGIVNYDVSTYPGPRPVADNLREASFSFSDISVTITPTQNVRIKIVNSSDYMPTNKPRMSVDDITLVRN
ncbi:MAG: fimbrillin family protein [Mangrovibacterium sp.]